MLVIAIIMVLVAPYVYQQLHKDKLINLKDFDRAATLLSTAEKGSPTNARSGKGVSHAFGYNKLQPGQTVEINTVDSAQLTRVHGIGPSFANRILTYRRKLGGFATKQQLKEVYGLDAEKYAEISNEIRVDASRIKRISVNAVDFEHLRRFPYLSYKQANAVIQYRVQHGDYRSLNDMRDIALLNDEILRKIAPYISFK